MTEKKHSHFPEYTAEFLGTACLAGSFGPALWSGVWSDQWIYAVAPPFGAVLGLGAFNLFTSKYREALTGKLCRAPNYRSVFRGDVTGADTTRLREPKG